MIEVGGRAVLHHGDCLEVLKTIPDCSVDSVVCDPPAGIAFMGKDWDKDKGGRDAWIAWMQLIAQECLRVIKHGGHALVWALPRTSHWTGMAWENAGWEPRDKIVHLFGTGFPKSRNLGGGLGTSLKPAAEDWWLMRKPLDGTIAGNVLKHGTGALNIDECRVETNGDTANARSNKGRGMGYQSGSEKERGSWHGSVGRWPANVITDGSDEVVAEFPADRPGMSGGGDGRRDASMFGVGGVSKPEHFRNDSGSAARFFYCTKASRRDREEGGIKNHHPTVKNTDLMRYLCRLITPPNGLVLDPFMGSGSTGKGCMYEGFRFIGIDQDAEYVEIAEARIRFAANAKDSSALTSAQTSIFE